MGGRIVAVVAEDELKLVGQRVAISVEEAVVRIERIEVVVDLVVVPHPVPVGVHIQWVC